MTVREAWVLARRKPLLSAAVVLMTVSSLLSAVAGRIAYIAVQDNEATVRRLDEVIRDGEAQRCVNAWEGRAQIRAAIAIPGEAIIEVATDAEPDAVAAFRDAVDRRVREAFPDPDCDLDAAHRELADS